MSQQELDHCEQDFAKNKCHLGNENQKLDLSANVNNHIFNKSLTPQLSNATQSSTEHIGAFVTEDTASKNNELPLPDTQRDGLYIKLLAENENLQYPPGWTYTHCLDGKVIMFSLLDALPSPTLGSNNVVPLLKKQVLCFTLL